jgi:3-hydroxyisobutyrate dehydrogenase-like beta-hydroxyacid dehydrogenase
MGTALAEVLMDAGHELIVHNRTIAKTQALHLKGARVAATPAEAIWASEVTLLVLADTDSIRQTLLSEAMRPVLAGRKFLNVTTTTAQDIRVLGQELDALGASLSEVTVTVYPDVIRARQGQFILGCPEAEEALWRGLLADIGPVTHRAGVLGDASQVDLAFIMAFAFNVMATAHAAALATRFHLPQALISHHLTKSPTLSIQGADALLPQMFSQRYATDTASIDSTLHVLRLALPVIQATGMPVDLLCQMLALYQEASDRGFGACDAAAVYEVLLTDRPTLA